jgi:hypothetical protein
MLVTATSFDLSELNIMRINAPIIFSSHSSDSRQSWCYTNRNISQSFRNLVRAYLPLDFGRTEEDIVYLLRLSKGLRVTYSAAPLGHI